jgi:hypothetical protein
MQHRSTTVLYHVIITDTSGQQHGGKPPIHTLPTSIIKPSILPFQAHQEMPHALPS